MKKILLHPFSLVILVSIFIQQIIVASSTIWIANLSDAVYAGDDNYQTWLLLFIISLTIVYIPTSVTQIYTNKAIFHLFYEYIDRFTFQYKSKATMKDDVEIQHKIRPYLTSEAFSIINECTLFTVTATGTFFNIIFNSIAIGMVLDLNFITVYLLSFMLMTGIVFASKKIIKQKTNQAQQSKVKVMQILISAWDTIFTGNPFNLSIWKASYNDKFNHANIDNIKMIFISQLFSVVSILVALLPIMIFLFLPFFQSGTSKALLLVTITTLPRQILLVQYMSDAIEYLIKFPLIKEKLSCLKSSLLYDYNIEKSKQNVSWGNIVINDNSDKNRVHIIKSPLDLEDIIAKGKGRYTIRGPNGSGKSTILKLLKQRYGQTSFLLPTKSDIYFSFSENLNRSSGEMIKSILKKSISQIKENIILLDEWDGNLDEQNIYNISNIINDIAKEKIVIEVRHRE